MPSTIADVLTLLLREPGRPRLTWYGPDGERVELSGAVLDNWVAKTTNLLVEELDAAPGTTVTVDLPPHWRALLWALAAWRTGSTVRFPAADEDGVAVPSDVLVTDRPGARAADAVVAVALPALARRFDGDLPPGALDAAASVMTYGDVIGWAPPADPAAPALVAGDRVVPHRDLVAAALASAPVPPGSRTLVRVDGDRGTTAPVLLAALGVLAGGGSVVLLTDGDDARADRVAADERVSAHLPTD